MRAPIPDKELRNASAEALRRILLGSAKRAGNGSMKLAVISHVLRLNNPSRGTRCRIVMNAGSIVHPIERIGSAVLRKASDMMREAGSINYLAELAQLIIEDVVEAVTGARYPYSIVLSSLSQGRCSIVPSTDEQVLENSIKKMSEVARALEKLGPHRMRDLLNACLRKAMKELAETAVGGNASVVAALEDLEEALSKGKPIIYNDLNKELRATVEAIKDVTALPLIPLTVALSHVLGSHQENLSSTPAMIYEGLVKLGEKLGEAPMLTLNKEGICGRRCVTYEDIVRATENISNQGGGKKRFVGEKELLVIGFIAYHLSC